MTQDYYCFSSSSCVKMSSRKVKSPGWAAFDLKQRQKQGLAPETDKDSYPPIPSTLTLASIRNRENVTRNTDLLVRPFSSVLLPAVEFPNLSEKNDYDTKGKHGHKAIEENNHDFALRKLKALHSWADSSLIEDVMASVENNIEQASKLLEGMVFSSGGGSEENKEIKITDLISTIDDSSYHRKTDENCFSVKTLDLSNLSTTGDGVKDNFIESADVHAFSVENDNAVDIKSIMKRLSSLPIEPEWEEDDVYLVHRKDAIKMMRSASQHSKAANNAFLRGDHFSAQQHSLNARKEWLIAERLNSKAAKEILSIRNSENDMWKLDLHGLHATEAVEALQERLQKIEMLIPMNRSVSPNRVKSKNGMVRTPSLESFNCTDMEIVDKQQASFRQISKSLQVITGVGNHSRGQAALPTAVKSFLSENGYRFDEARPGVATVRPKFRHRNGQQNKLSR